METTTRLAVGGDRVVRLLGPIGALAAGGAVLAVVHVVDPNEPGHYPTCPFLFVTGRWCPGCGSLRALHALTDGDLGAAAHLNLLLLSCLPLLAVMWGRWSRRSWSGAPRGRPAAAGWLWAFLVIVVAFAVLRNTSIGVDLAP